MIEDDERRPLPRRDRKDVAALFAFVALEATIAVAMLAYSAWTLSRPCNGASFIQCTDAQQIRFWSAPVIHP